MNEEMPEGVEKLSAALEGFREALRTQLEIVEIVARNQVVLLSFERALEDIKGGVPVSEALERHGADLSDFTLLEWPDGPPDGLS